MIDRQKQEIVRFLNRHPVGQLAICTPTGPWATVARFFNHGLTLYVVEPQTSDLMFYLEEKPEVVLTVDHQEIGSGHGSAQSVQIFGVARTLENLREEGLPEFIRATYSAKNRESPGVYALVEVQAERVYRTCDQAGIIHRDTIDLG